MLGHPAGEGVVAGQQLHAPAFCFVQGQRILCAAELHGGHRFADGLHVVLAHQLADVLHLAALALEGLGALVLGHRIAQRLGNGQVDDAVIGQADERLAEVLQLVHLFLELGLAGAIELGGAVVIGMSVVGRGGAHVGLNHRSWV